MAGNPISPLLADAALVFLWPRLLRESRPSHIPISRLPCGKRRKGSVSALCVCKGDTPPTCSEIILGRSEYVVLGLEIKLLHQFPPSRAGCAAVYLRLGSRLQYPPHASQYVLSDYLSLGRRTRYYKETRADYYFLKHASSLWMGILGCAIQI